MYRLLFILGKILGCFNQIAPVLFRIRRGVTTGYYAGRFRKFDSSSRIEGKLGALTGADCIEIGERCNFGKGMKLTAWKRYRNHPYHPSIKIGNYCQFGDFSQITAVNSIHIGNNVLTGRGVLITDNSHGEIARGSMDTPPSERPLVSKNGVKIDDNVWIGEYACILPGITVGRGSVIGASAVVTKDVAPYTVVGGNPARLIKDVGSNKL